jgi:hypothetical protein
MEHKNAAFSPMQTRFGKPVVGRHRRRIRKESIARQNRAYRLGLGTAIVRDVRVEEDEISIDLWTKLRRLFSWKRQSGK